MRNSPAPPIWLTRIGWLALIWATSVVALAIVALVFRIFMHAAELSSI
jgi:hypothetical protein